MNFSRAGMRRRRAGLLALVALALAGCARHEPPRAARFTWWIGRALPAFDPGGAPDPVRWVIERAASRALTAVDSAGSVLPAAAARWECSADSLRWTFHLRDGLRFTDGTPCTSGDFARTMRAGLARTDHGSFRWLLGSLAGVEKVRAGKPLPALGIETPDSVTLVLALARPDARIPARLALPLFAPWKEGARGEGWAGAVGLGPWRLPDAPAATHFTLLRDRAGRTPADPDTLLVRWGPGLGRARNVLRAGSADFVWPLPPGLEQEAPPAAYRRERAAASPARHLVLVMRADVPATTKLAARQALAHGLETGALSRRLEGLGSAVHEWIAPGVAPDLPRFDAREVSAWRERGKLGASVHATLAFDPDGPAALVARSLQGEWAGLGIYVELLPLRGAAFRAEALGGWRAQLLLVETAPLARGADAEYARWVMPMRGAAAGNFRTGWRPPDLPAWDSARPLPDRPLETLQNRLEVERIAIPLATLDWQWVVRGPAPPIHPGFGPDFANWEIPPVEPVRR